MARKGFLEVKNMLGKRGLVTAGLCCCVSILVWTQSSEAGPGTSGKVTICHKADPVKYLQITVASRAVPAHLNHGDCVVDDGVPCTVDRCDANLGCIHAPDDNLCDDTDACTIDVCDPSPVSTGCVYTPVSCDDGDACTADSCDPSAGCQNIDNLTCRGACCFSEGCIDNYSHNDCGALQGTYLGNDTTCELELAACPTGACCLEGFCFDFESQGFHLSQTVCEDLGGAYLGDGTTCAKADTTCRGACCFSEGCIDNYSHNDCGALQGTYLGNDTTCELELAACPTGACCLEGFCFDFESQGFHLSQTVCEDIGGAYLGDGTTCTGTIPCDCAAVCGDGCCGPGENMFNCFEDCAIIKP